MEGPGSLFSFLSLDVSLQGWRLNIMVIWQCLCPTLPSTVRHSGRQGNSKQALILSTLHQENGLRQIAFLVGHSTRKVLSASPVLLAGKARIPQMGCLEQQEHTSICMEIPASLTPLTQSSRERAHTSDLLIKVH